MNVLTVEWRGHGQHKTPLIRLLLLTRAIHGALDRGGFACLHWLDRHQWQWTAHPHIALEAMRLVLWHLQHNDRLIYPNLTDIVDIQGGAWTNMDWTASDERYRRDVERYVCLSSTTENKLKMIFFSRVFMTQFKLQRVNEENNDHVGACVDRKCKRMLITCPSEFCHVDLFRYQ